jgi:ubiquitin C-terminal hydrolase
MSLWSVPDVLIFHLKRFGVHNGTAKKSMAKVDFDEEIDMAPYVTGQQKNEVLKFRLFAVIHHIGTMHGGHYIATIHTEGQGWFAYNDDAVYEVSQKNVFSDSAYVLLYRRILQK